MSQFTRRVFSNGKVTIPQELRDLYHIRDGDLVELVVRRVEPSPDASKAAQVQP